MPPREGLVDPVYEQASSAGWGANSQRRKQNYLPFIVGVLEILKRKKKLATLVQRSQQGTALGQQPQSQGGPEKRERPEVRYPNRRNKRQRSDSTST